MGLGRDSHTVTKPAPRDPRLVTASSAWEVNPGPRGCAVTCVTSLCYQAQQGPSQQGDTSLKTTEKDKKTTHKMTKTR